ncbi:MAG: LamG-like jellyroll fold domain-containing protein, partial [Candidatus Kariarchaeaceae archaeon]
MRSFINRIFCLTLLITITITCSITFAQSNNNSYVFDGETGYAAILDNEILNEDADKSAFQYFDNPAFANHPLFENDVISVEAWVYLIGEATGNVPIVYRSINSTYNTFSLYIENGEGKFSIGGGVGVVSTGITIPAFQWIHLAGTYDSQTLKLYYGGDLVDTQENINLGAGYETGEGLFIGKSEDGFFRGLIDEVRIWRFTLQHNHINNSGGNGTPSESIPQSIVEYLNGRWSFTEFSYFNNVKSLEDRSDYNNHLRVYNIDEIVNSKHPPFFVVNSTGDEPDSLAGNGNASTELGTVTLRSAIEETNELQGPRTIYFYIPGSAPFIIQPGSSLPAITDQVFIDATFQSGYSGLPIINIDGTTAGSPDGLTISGGESLVQGLSVQNFSGSGIVLETEGNNTIINNTVSNNGLAGVAVKSGANNSILFNSIHSNGGPGIDLWTTEGNSGITENDPLDGDEGGNHLQNYPVLTDFYSGSGGTSIKGYLESTSNQTFTLQFYSNSPSGLLDPRNGELYLGEKIVTTGSDGRIEFQANLSDAEVNIADGYSVSATATDVNGNTSEFSAAIITVLEDGFKYLLNKTFGGIPLHWKNGKAKYSIAPSVFDATPSGNSDFALEIQEAFNTFSSLDQLNYTQRFLPPDSTNENWGGEPDGVNNIVWMTPAQWAETELPENVLASTRVRYSVLTGENIDVDVAFNSAPYSTTQNTTFDWSSSGSGTDGKLDVRNCGDHEFMHFTGLKDLYNPGDPAYVLGVGMGAHNEEQTAYGRININEVKKRSLYDDGNTPRVEGDIAGIEAIYNAVDNSLVDIVL